MDDGRQPRPARTAAGPIEASSISRGIMPAIPHRYPFLLIDRMVDVVLGRSATGIKNVSVNEPFFAGHFPTIRSCPAC